MRRKLAFMLMLLILTSQSISFADGFRVGDEAVYLGIQGYKNISNNIKYNDINKSFAKDSIIKLTALNIFETGIKKFNPKSYIRQEEAIEYIAKAFGMDKVDLAYLMFASNIISLEEYYTIVGKPEDSTNATREQVALWIAFSLGLEGRNPYMVRGFKDYDKFNSRYIYLMESFIQRGYMIGYSDGYFRPNKPITREQFAETLDNALDDILTMRGYQIKEGEVYNIINNVTTQGSHPVIQTIYYMRNTDGTYPVIHTYKSNVAYTQRGFLIYDSGNLTTSHSLAVGDTIKYYIDPSGSVVFALTKDIY